MRSIKRGRGPSFMSGVGSVAAAVFGVFWTMMAVGMGAPLPFAAFGLIFIGLAVAEAVYNFKNATGKERYSEYDITEEGEEPDPLNECFGQQNTWREDAAGDGRNPSDDRREYAFCPYCGSKLDRGDIYCSKCGRKIG